MIRSATSRLCSTLKVTGLDSPQRTSHFFSLFMRTWKGVLTIRSPLSTSPAIRETDGAQSFSPEVAEISRATETQDTLWGPQQFRSLAHSAPCLSIQCIHQTPTYRPLLPRGSGQHRLFEPITHAISPHTWSSCCSFHLRCQSLHHICGTLDSVFGLSLYCFLQAALPTSLEQSSGFPTLILQIQRQQHTVWT